MEAWLDVAVLRCPKCGQYFVDASWYVVEMESDIECGNCGVEFNSKKHATDRVMLKFQIDEDGKMRKIEITEHLKISES